MFWDGGWWQNPNFFLPCSFTFKRSRRETEGDGLGLTSFFTQSCPSIPSPRWLLPRGSHESPACFFWLIKGRPSPSFFARWKTGWIQPIVCASNKLLLLLGLEPVINFYWWKGKGCFPRFSFPAADSGFTFHAMPEHLGSQGPILLMEMLCIGRALLQDLLWSFPVGFFLISVLLLVSFSVFLILVLICTGF